MKKLLILSATGIAGLASASNGIYNEPPKVEKEVTMECISYGMLIWCTDEVIDDTVCWGAGTDVKTRDDATKCMIRNGQLLTESICGMGTGSGPAVKSLSAD